jgi:hypothetical protein
LLHFRHHLEASPEIQRKNSAIIRFEVPIFIVSC